MPDLDQRFLQKVADHQDDGENCSVPKRRVEQRWPILAGAALVAVVLGVGAWLYFARKAQALTERDTIVLSDFTNTTGDAIFDDTLKTASTFPCGNRLS